MIIKINVDEIKQEKVHGGGLAKEIMPHDVLKAFSGIWQMTVPPGVTLESHSHENEEQIYCILDGEGIIIVGEDECRVRSGDIIYLPPKIAHSFRNDGKKPCIYIGVGAYLKRT